MKLTVHVEYDDGSLARNSKVFLSIHSWPASTWTESYTDEHGDAEFDISENDGIEITFIVDGTEYQTESVSDGECVHITVT